MIKVQLLLYGLDYGGDDETETINNGILVYPIQKFTRILIFRCQGNKEYGRVEVDADLETSKVNRWSFVKQFRTCADPDP
jgi:hypothetical protein